MPRNVDPDRQRRHGINDEERKRIRKYAKENPLLKQKEIATWATDKLRRRITQGQISSIISSKYAYVDSKSWGSKGKRYERLQRPQWPVLEAALFEWHMTLQAAAVPINSELIRATAKALWIRLPEYRDQPIPEFSNNFIHRYKKRHGIQKYKQHGEAASAEITEDTERDMNTIREKLLEYREQDIYNMDETGLFWKALPDTTLATEQQAGKKKEKARISIALCCNADGSHKLPLWFIGKSRHPVAFGGTGNPRIRPLGCEYRNNAKSWMTTQIMDEWLLWFDRQVGRRNLLILDGFGAHKSAVEQLEEENKLQYTK